MAASGALAPFLQTMLGLRAQRLQEEEIKAKLAAAQQEEMMKGIQQAGSAFVDSMKGMKKDTAANKLMEEYFGGGGGGVPQDASFAGAKAAAGGASPYGGGRKFTGGADELAQRIQLEQLRQTINDKRAGDIWKERNFGLNVANYNLRAAADQRAASKATYANQLMEKAPERAKEIFNASRAIQEKSGNLIEGMNAAMASDDYDKYLQLAREHNALNDAHKGMKLTTAMTDVPPFVGAKQAKIMANLMGAEGGTDPEVARAMNLKGTAAQPIRQWGPEETENLQEARAKAQGQMSRGFRMPGGPLQAPPAAPANAPLNPEMVNRVMQSTPGGGGYSQQEAQTIMGGQAPAGGSATSPGAPAPGAAPIKVNPNTGQRITVRNGQWVDLNTGQPVK